MRNHDQKTKDMIESVLPSAARLTARRMRRQIHASRRVRETQALRRHWRTDRVDDWALGDATFVSDMYDMVWSRRAADKVGSLTRWAIRRVATEPRLRDASLADQVGHFRALLPDNTVGRHALQHIEWALRAEFSGMSWSPGAHRRQTEAAIRERTQVMTEQLHLILSAGRHSELNRRLKRIVEQEAAAGRPANWQFVPAPRRLLAGAHDIKDFVREVQASTAIQGLLAELSS